MSARPRARIVPARADDAAAIAALEERSFPVEDRFPLATWRRLLGASAKRGTALTLVARRRGDVVGAVSGLMRATSRVIRVYSLAVDPAARGQGLGERLLRALAREAPKRCRDISLEVRADNPARALYQRVGMRVVATLPKYYDGADGVRYRGATRDVAR